MQRQDIRILILDRNPHVREYLQREFLKLGYGVAVCDRNEPIGSTPPVTSRTAEPPWYRTPHCSRAI